MYKTNTKAFPLHGDTVLSGSVCPPSSRVSHRLLVPLGRWTVSDITASCNFFVYLPLFSRPLEHMQGYQEWTRMISKSYPSIEIVDNLTEEEKKTHKDDVCPLWSSLATETLQRCQGTQGKQNISIKVFYFTCLTASCQWIIPWLRKKCLQRFIKTTPAQAWRVKEMAVGGIHLASHSSPESYVLSHSYTGASYVEKIVACLKSRQPGTQHQEILILSSPGLNR